MSWLQLIINTTKTKVNEFDDALVDAGALSVTLEDQADQPILEPGVGETPLWQDTRVIALFMLGVDTGQISQNIELQLGAGFDHRWELLEDRDWEREWMKHYHPIQCGPGLWICPSWQSPPDPTAVNLLLDPGLAFGTGTHPTTFLCLQWLESLELQGSTVIDYGCGSGILAIAALLLGAEHAYCIDNDPQALLATVDNAERNKIQPEKYVSALPDKLCCGVQDIVVANILAGPLVELSGTLADKVKPGGRLCLSGIIAEQVTELMQVYAQWFDFDEPVFKEEWVRLTATKRL